MTLLLLRLLPIVLAVAQSSSSSLPPNPNTLSTSSYPNFQHLNVKQTISSLTKLKQNTTSELYTASSDHAETEAKDKWKLLILHRDKMNTLHTHHHHHHRHQRHHHNKLFQQRMLRDARRVNSIIRRLSNNINISKYVTTEDDFGAEVVSGMEQGSGEYFVRVGVGSPARSQYMVIDSGSDMVWVQCQPCTQCYQQTDPVFDPALSASYAGVPCSSAVCTRLENHGCRAGRCRYQVSYADGSFTRGTLALETITLGRTLVRNVAIGCGHMNRGMFVGAAGLLGLGGGSMSFVGQLGGHTGGAFSYCLVSRGGDEESGSPGWLEFGREGLPVGAAWVPLVRNPWETSFYYIGLVGLGVGGERVGLSEEVFGLSAVSGSGGVVMDTGTAVTRLPVEAYVAFRDAFIRMTAGLPRASGVSIFDTCYDLSGFISVRVPTVSFYLSGGPILTLPARNFLIPVDAEGTFCFAFAASPSGLSIIGNIQQEGIQISVDGANGFVGFGPNVC